MEMVTFELGNVHAELVSFFENTLPSCFDECVELDRELGHAIAKLIESEMDAWKGIGHRWRKS